MIIDSGTLSQSLVTRLLDELHDRWFKIDTCHYNDTSQEFTLHFGERKKGPHPGRLVVSGVAAVEIFDDARIGTYDIASVDFDVGHAIILIKSAFPLTLQLSLGVQWRIETRHPDSPDSRAIRRTG